MVEANETMKKLTPVFVVEQIEPCLAFWVDRLGFARGVEVPHGDSLGFVILTRGGVEIMYQTRASALEDARRSSRERRRGRRQTVPTSRLTTSATWKIGSPVGPSCFPGERRSTG